MGTNWFFETPCIQTMQNQPRLLAVLKKDVKLICTYPWHLIFIIISSCVIGSKSSTRFCVSCCVWYSGLHCHISHQCLENLCSDHQLLYERVTDQSCTRPAVPCTHRYTAVQTTYTPSLAIYILLHVKMSWILPNIFTKVFLCFAVLQFVPSHIDVRMCTFSEQTEKGLITALAEVRRRSQESTNFTVNVSWLLYPVNSIKSLTEFKTPISWHWTPSNPLNSISFWFS